jgi:hypothetical protein
VVIERVVKIPVTSLEFDRFGRRDLSGLSLLCQLRFRFVDRVSQCARFRVMRAEAIVLSEQSPEVTSRLLGFGSALRFHES